MVWEAWHPFVEEKVDEIKPVGVVADFFGMPPIDIAMKREIPVVINFPGPVQFLSDDMNIVRIPNMKTVKLCCGCLCIEQSWMHWIMYVYYMKIKWPESLPYNEKFQQNVILVNSFWGLDQARCLPPNVLLTGPLFKS